MYLQNPKQAEFGILEQRIGEDSEARFLLRFHESQTVLKNMASAGYNYWITTFSGGKDSTTTAVVALETALKLEGQVERIDIVYSDTMLEIPSIHQYALSFLQFLQQSPRVANLPLYCHIVYPKTEERFWACLLGKGYPPPHQRFRWCTRRLKIEPVEDALRSFIRPGRTLLLTGVRFRESQNRDIRLALSCRRGGECGQGLWFRYSARLQVGHLAPIVHWSECDVWDFLQYASFLGYPTGHLEENVYNGRETRFGCWMCTVVRQDKAMEKTAALSEWSHLQPLLDFRQRVKDLTSDFKFRVIRPDGKPGRLTLTIRRQLLGELLDLQATIGMSLISPEEIRAIESFWQSEKYGERYKEVTSDGAS